jgi:hypothetical protein
LVAGLSVAILIDARSQPVYGSLSQFFSRIFFKRADHNVTTYSATGLMSLAPEKFPNGWTGLPFYRPQMVGIHAFESDPANINARELVRDASFSNDDKVEILLDTNHDRRNAFRFAVNPLNTTRCFDY